MLSQVPLPEHLPGEPDRSGAVGVVLWARVFFGAWLLVGLALATATLWLPYFLMVGIVGWPPNVPLCRQVFRYLGYTWKTPAGISGLTLGRRLWLTILIARKAATVPVWGIAWLIDELLYGGKLNAVPVVAPLFEISAARSGSTQLARYLEDDPALVAPSLIHGFFPYLWAWKLAPKMLGWWLTPQRVHDQLLRLAPPEFLERHEADPFRTDTFEASLYVAHLNHLGVFFGPEIMVAEFAGGEIAPHNRDLWARDFVDMVDRIGRKRLVQLGPTAEGSPRRLFVKGHFLGAADALAKRFPDARFLTMIREPQKRFQSAINYIRVNPLDATLGPPRWDCVVGGVLEMEVAYCELEHQWYTASPGPSRCVVRFDDYVRDLPGTVSRIYRECLGTTVPAHIPTEHPPRKRQHYQVDRSLAQLGIDATAVNARLSAYCEWCRPEPPTPPFPT